MEILEPFALTNRFRAAGELAGRLRHTVEQYVALRDAGRLPVGPEPVQRPRLIDPHLAKVEEWVERSNDKIRADVVFDKLAAMGYCGFGAHAAAGGREVKANHRAGRRRVYRPWIPEPGMWAQWDWGQGPRIAVGQRTCSAPGWRGAGSRVVIATWDRTLPTLIGCLDRAMRTFGGCPPTG